MIRFPCPRCGYRLSAPDVCVGRSSRCRGCGERVTVPAREGGMPSDLRVIGVALSVIAGVMLWFAGWWFVYLPYERQQRADELIRKEPWRRFVSEPYRSDPNYHGDW